MSTIQFPNTYNESLSHDDTRAPSLAEMYGQCQPTLREMKEFEYNPGLKAHTRRLHALLSQLAEVVETHVFHKQSHHYEKEQKAKTNVANVQSYTGWQGYGHLLAAIVTPFLAPFNLTALSSEGVAALEKVIEGWKQGDQFEESLFLQLSSSERQALEGIKNLPKEIQHLISKLLETEKEAIRMSSQR